MAAREVSCDSARVAVAAIALTIMVFCFGCTTLKPTDTSPPVKVVHFSKDTIFWNVPFSDTLHARDLSAASAKGSSITMHLIDSRQGMSVRDSVFSWTPKDTGDVYINATVCEGAGGCDTLRDTFHVRFASPLSRPYRLSRDTIVRFAKFSDTLRADSIFKARFGNALFTVHSFDTALHMDVHDSVISWLALDTGRVRFRLAQCISNGPCDTLSFSLYVKNGTLPPLLFRFRKDSLCLYLEYDDTVRQSRFSAAAAMGRLSAFTVIEGPSDLSIKDSFFVWTPHEAGKISIGFAARDTTGRYYSIHDTFFVRYCSPDIQCPAYTHKNDAVIGQVRDLPDGFFVYSNDYYIDASSMAPRPGLFMSDLKTFAPSIIHGTETDFPRSPKISGDGKWILYAAADKAYLVRTDGSIKREVPLTVGVNSVDFYRHGPYGVEICYTTTDTVRSEIYAIPVTLDSVPTFGTSRKIADLTGSFRIEPYYPISVVKDQILGAFSLRISGGYSLRMGFLTIPGAGQQTAGPQNMYTWKDDDGKQYWGCNSTMSWDGSLCLYIAGVAGMTGSYQQCIPQEHRGFVVTPFRRAGDSAITMDDHIDLYGLSINWCPSQYNYGKWEEMDFHGWYFGNRNDVAIGSLSGSLAPHKGIWMVDWKRNIWTQLTPPDSIVNADQPAVFFTEPDTGNPLDPQYRVIRPNGGEVFTIGQPCTVSVTARRDANAAVRISIDNGKYSFLLPGLVSAINPRADSIIVFTMPATFAVQEPNPLTGTLKDVEISSVSNACRICIQDYTAISGFSDCSDSVFQINAAH